LWSTGGILIKNINLNPFVIAGVRSGVAACVMLVYLRSPIRKWNSVKLLGALMYTMTVVCFVTANKLTSAANTILLQFSAPIWVALFARWFLKEKIRLSDWVAIAIVLSGMTLFFIENLQFDALLGNSLAVLSGVALASVVILLKLQKDCSPIEMTLLGNILTFVICLPFVFKTPPDARSMMYLLVLGIFQLGISYILYAIAVQHVSAVEAILIPVLEPLLNPVWVFIFSGESPGYYAIVGGIIVVTTIIFRSIYQQRKAVKKLLVDN